MAVDREQCLGKDRCGMLCRQACPYEVPQFGTEENPKMQMCTLCPGRLAAGQKPICVAACPMRALDAGPLDELREQYGEVKQVEGFAHAATTNPSIIFKSRY